MDDEAIRRLRDVLLRRGTPASIPPPSPDAVAGAAQEHAAMVRRMRPFVEIMFLVMCADGAIDPAERSTLRGAVRSLTGDRLRSETIDELIEDARQALERDGLDGRLDDIAATVYDDQEVASLALALASAVAQADNRVAPEEKRVLLG
jgi:tellurite resistance protein